jgi:hypothetical protein
MTSNDATIILCTVEELQAMHQRGEISDQGPCLVLQDLFEVLCDHYGVQPHWSPSDIY